MVQRTARLARWSGSRRLGARKWFFDVSQMAFFCLLAISFKKKAKKIAEDWASQSLLEIFFQI